VFKPRPPRNLNEAWVFTCLNLFATPGLGSVLARRFQTGTLQLLIAVTGFSLIIWWFIQRMRLLYGQIYGTDLPMDAGNTAGKWGVFFFGVAWIWALMTSIQIIKMTKTPSPLDVPPKIL
jgi:hypothetical protein